MLLHWDDQSWSQAFAHQVINTNNQNQLVIWRPLDRNILNFQLFSPHIYPSLPPRKELRKRSKYIEEESVKQINLSSRMRKGFKGLMG